MFFSCDWWMLQISILRLHCEAAIKSSHGASCTSIKYSFLALEFDPLPIELRSCPFAGYLETWLDRGSMFRFFLDQKSESFCLCKFVLWWYCHTRGGHVFASRLHCLAAMTNSCQDASCTWARYSLHGNLKRYPFGAGSIHSAGCFHHSVTPIWVHSRTETRVCGLFVQSNQPWCFYAWVALLSWWLHHLAAVKSCQGLCAPLRRSMNCHL
jgi:hypothetical protein